MAIFVNNNNNNNNNNNDNNNNNSDNNRQGTWEVREIPTFERWNCMRKFIVVSVVVGVPWSRISQLQGVNEVSRRDCVVGICPDNSIVGDSEDT